MNITLRSLIAVSAAAVFLAGVTVAAEAAKTSDHSTLTHTELDETGFLGFKSFLIGSSGRDEPGLALESMRLISPATLFSNGLKNRPSILPTQLFLPLEGASAPVLENMDNLTIDIKGEPVTLSLGLKEALHKDVSNHLDLHGISGLENPAAGVASAAYLRSATDDVMTMLDRLETLNSQPLVYPASAAVPGRIVRLEEPPTILLFLTGLLFLVWLRGERPQTRSTE